MKKAKKSFTQMNKGIFICLAIFILLQMFASPVLADDDSSNVQAIVEVQKDETIKVEIENNTWLYPREVVGQPTGGREKHVYPDLDQVNASNYIVADLDTEEIILGLNVDEIAYPASMTKIMTALTVIESADFDLKKAVVFSEHAVALPSPVSARAGFVVGEETTTENALYLMMVQSANDCARALAETYGGSEEKFANMMNELAKEIGCENTHLVDASGFGLEDHHFTPRDLMKIIKRAMQHDIFRELVKTKAYSSEPTNVNPYTAWTMVTNSNHLMMQGDLNLSSEYLHTYDGVKTGTTDIAGNCLSATVHTYDGRHLCAIIFNGSLTDRPGEFFSVSVLLRTLLEEAAKEIDAPTETEAYKFLASNPSIAEEVSGFQDLCHLSELYKDGQLSDDQIKALVSNVEDEDESQDIPKDVIVQSIDDDGNKIKITQASASSNPEQSGSSLSFLDTNTMQYLLLGMWLLLFVIIIILIIQAHKRTKRRRARQEWIERERLKRNNGE